MKYMADGPQTDSDPRNKPQPAPFEHHTGPLPTKPELTPNPGNSSQNPPQSEPGRFNPNPTRPQPF